MRTQKLINEEMAAFEDVRGVLEVYEEMAAKRMQEIRKMIEGSRTYFERLANLSEEVGADLRMKADRGKGEAAVFISANAKLFGEIVSQVLGDFLTYIKKHQCDVYVAGKVGLEMMREVGWQGKFKEIDLTKEEMKGESLRLAMAKLGKYKKIRLFYGQFLNIANQRPAARTMSGKMLEELMGKSGKVRLGYLYEPSPEEIGNKFGKEILASVLEQTVKEAQLAKFASRMMRLSLAVSKLENKKVELKREWWQVGRREENKRQGLRLASFQIKQKGGR